MHLMDTVSLKRFDRIRNQIAKYGLQKFADLVREG